MMARPTFKEIGRRESVFGPRLVGFMRWTAGGAAATLGLGVMALSWAAFEARKPTLRRFNVEVPKRPRLRELNILHISDLHMFEGQAFIARFLADVAAKEQIDLVVSTGDNLGDEEAVPLLLGALKPLLNKPGAFVLGSNDYYSPDMKAWTAYLDPSHAEKAIAAKQTKTPNLPWLEMVTALTDAGWLDMSNQAENLKVKVTGDDGRTHDAEVSLIGVDDPHIMRDHMPKPKRKWRKDEALKLALTHSPYMRVVEEFSELGADLILAGHTHGGQVRLPVFGALVNNTDMPRLYSRGLHRWHGVTQRVQSWLHISAGLGTSKYAPIRFACRPEVSLIRVCPTDQ